MSRSVSMSDNATPEKLSRANTGVYNMARIRKVMALDNEAREKLAKLISDDTDAFDLPGSMNDFDVNDMSDEEPEDRDGIFAAWLDEEFISACAGDRETALAGIDEIKEWLLQQLDALMEGEGSGSASHQPPKRRSA